MIRGRIPETLVLGLLLIWLGTGCSGRKAVVTVPLSAPMTHPSPSKGVSLKAEGISGLAQVDPTTYLVVHDTKGGRPGPRLGLLRVSAGAAPAYEALAVPEDAWQDDDGPSSDLESACPLPGRTDEFLVAESTRFEGKYGRIFHLRLEETGESFEPRILASLPLPGLAESTEDTDGDNFEGIACAPLEAGRYLVILGERGGSQRYPHGVLRWGIFDPGRKLLRWEGTGRDGKEVTVPGFWVDPETRRDISDLYLDPRGILWAVGSEDAGDGGPFRSVIYRLARVVVDSDDPVELLQLPLYWTVDGFKVEGLSGPAGSVPGSHLSFATEDEDMGGVWRPLFPPPGSQ